MAGIRTSLHVRLYPCAYINNLGDCNIVVSSQGVAKELAGKNLIYFWKMTGKYAILFDKLCPRVLASLRFVSINAYGREHKNNYTHVPSFTLNCLSKQGFRPQHLVSTGN